jgi:hypothetical protein
MTFNTYFSGRVHQYRWEHLLLWRVLQYKWARVLQLEVLAPSIRQLAVDAVPQDASRVVSP